MPFFEVRSLDDVWGNAAEGFEINDASRVGDVYVAPEWGERDIVVTLVKAGLLKKQALKSFDDEELIVETGGQDIELLEGEEEWAGVDARGNQRWLDIPKSSSLETALKSCIDEEEADLVEGWRPVFSLVDIGRDGGVQDPEFEDFGFETFYEVDVGEATWVRAMVNRDEPLAVLVFTDSDGIADDFELPIRGWTDRVKLPQAQLNRMEAALDYFLETGKKLK